MPLVTNLSCLAVSVEDTKLEFVFSMPLIFSDTSCCLAELRNLR